MVSAKVLVIEDEADLIKLLRYNLEKEGYQVVCCQDGETGLAAFRKEQPDFLILDLMLPRLSGLELCQIIRQESKVPILILTARREEVDRVLGLELGADDYVTKPFSVREVMARIKVIFRRVNHEASLTPIFQAVELVVDVAKYEARMKGMPLSLSSKEFELLVCLLKERGKVLTRDRLLERIWGYDRSMEIDTRTVDQHIARLRGKLGAEAHRILTVKNVGYRLKVD